jgi:branched-chain amino acid transport system permease protein
MAIEATEIEHRASRPGPMYRHGLVRSGVRTYAGVVLLAAVVMAISTAMPDYIDETILVAALWAYWSTSWNVVGGFAGQLSMGHTMFIAVGAYGTAVLFANARWSPWLGMLCVTAGAAALAYGVGLMLFRWKLRGSFFALGTFALGQIVLYVVLNVTFLGAGQGFLVPPGSGLGALQFSSRLPYVAWSLLLVVVGISAAQLVRRSRFGHRLVAIREDEDAAAAMGINVQQEKCRAFAVSGAMTALGAVLYVQYVLYVDPQSVAGEIPAVQIVLFAIFGGSGTVWGPLVGAGILYPLTDYLRTTFSGTIAGLDLIIDGFIFILVVPLLPDGLAGVVKRLVHGRNHLAVRWVEARQRVLSALSGRTTTGGRTERR